MTPLQLLISLPRRMRYSVLAFSLLALLAVTSSFATAADDLREDHWHVIYLSGTRVGYGRTTVRNVDRDREKLVETVVEEHLTIKRFGQTLKMATWTRTEETLDGRIVRFSHESQNPPAQPTISRGTVSGRTLNLEETIDGRVTTRRLNWDPEVKSPVQQDLLFKEPPLKPGDSLSFKAFLPELSKVSSVRLDADEYRAVKLQDGSERKLLKVRVTQSALPGVGMRNYVDEQGIALRIEADLLGMVSYEVSRDVALQEIVGAELDVALNAIVIVKNPPVSLNNQRTAVLRITTPGRDPAEFIPASESQSVTRVSPDTIELTTAAVPVPKQVPRARNDLASYLGSTAFLQTRDLRVQEHARRAAAGSQDPGTIATRLEEYVYRELKKKNFSTVLGSASEVARTMEGDCTEHAVLLAAMLRNQGIPSRVAVGLIYSGTLSGFGGHMWTEAWLDGHWVPLDATLGQGGIGAGHIKLADSDLGDEGPAPVTAFMPLLTLLNDVQIDVIRFSR